MLLLPTPGGRDGRKKRPRPPSLAGNGNNACHHSLRAQKGGKKKDNDLSQIEERRKARLVRCGKEKEKGAGTLKLNSEERGNK